MEDVGSVREILGIQFFTGSVPELLARVKQGGLVLVPSGPGLADMPSDPVYKQALENADIVLTDSGFMILCWQLVKGERLPRISGLKFLIALIEDRDFVEQADSFWVMPTSEESEINRKWLKTKGINLRDSDFFIAPLYPPDKVEDPELLQQLLQRRPRYIIINIGGGIQEKLGDYLRRHLDYKPTIVCTGAAIAFLTGQQAPISPWADKYFLGWLMRCLKAPGRFIPRYWRARRLFWLLLKYKDRSPPSAVPQ